MEIDVSLPDEFLKYFDDSPEKLQKINRIILAIDLYLEQKVSIGKAAELSGLPFDEFHEELSQRKIKRLGGPLSVNEAENELRIASSFMK